MDTATAPVTCPQCKAPLAPYDLVCTECGSSVMLAALMAERALISRRPGGTDRLRPASLELLLPRLGDYLLSQGFITQVQLQAALAQQTDDGPRQHSRLLGQRLVEMGAITREALDRVIAQQIFELQEALLEANRTLERRVAARTAELETTLARLTELNQLKANFIANISHELRTPLTQVKGYNFLMNDGALGAPSAEMREALDVSRRAIERLEQLINDLIEYASAAKGEITLRVQRLEPARLLTNTADRASQAAAKKKVVLATDCSPDLPMVQGDEEKLTWVLWQLADNGVKFTPAGGQVTVSVDNRDGLVRFAVRDSGIGIPASRLTEIFEPFQQLDGTSTRRYGGTGLGLALVRRIVEAHGSEIRVTSREHEGSEFSFYLPAAPPA